MSDTTTAHDLVWTERIGNVLLVTLNRPELRNAVNGEMAEGLARAVDELDEDPNLGAGVLTGSGGVFCAGMDLGAFAEGETPFVDGRGFAGIVQKPPRKPLIAAIEGFAVAGGFEIALACDLIVAGRSARMGIPETKRSLLALGGALLRLPRRMPHHLVMELALTGDLFPAERLHQFGVVNRLAPDGEARKVAVELAEHILRNGPLALQASKQIVNDQWDWTSSEAWEKQAAIASPVIHSADALEGAVAFKDKRDPVWKGH